MNNVEITIKKPMTDDEVNGFAYVHWKCWHETYTGLIDDSYLDNVTIEKSMRIAKANKNMALIAKYGERTIGLVGNGAYRDENDSTLGEVYAIYVLREFQRLQVGYRLMQAAIQELCGYTRVALWVLDGNERAISFYERYGFRFDGVEKKVQLGREAVERRMIYTVTERG